MTNAAVKVAHCCELLVLTHGHTCSLLWARGLKSRGETGADLLAGSPACLFLPVNSLIRVAANWRNLLETFFFFLNLGSN